MKNNLIKSSMFDAFAVALYVSVVAYLIQNGERIFGKMQNFWGPLAFLLLFVVSAAIVGSIIFGKPVVMYLEGKKTEAVKLLSYTIMWLFAATIIVLLVQYILK